MLSRSLGRDLWHLRGPLLAAALVIACGIGALVAIRGTYQSLQQSQTGYYLSHRFADVFAHLKRAPATLAEQIHQIPGVAQVQTRLAVEVSADIPGLSEPAIVKLVSVPGSHAPLLNDLQIVRGRYLDAGAADQVLVSEAFAQANGLRVGDQVALLLHGRWQQAEITGLAQSPEFVYEVGPGMVFPDNRRYGVMWMDHEPLAAAFGMQGAFNDVSLSLARGANGQDVLAALDRLLLPYGGLSAHGREAQLSHRFLTDELGELGVMSSVLPALFLAVSAFLLYLVLSRLVATQRTQIGLLKAFGFTNLRVGLHYLYLALATVTLGWALGLPTGIALGVMFIDLYREFFRFPSLRYGAEPALLLLAAMASGLAAAAGALGAVRRATLLPPAEAMRPEPPAAYRNDFLNRLAWLAGWSASARMIARSLLRRPGRALGSILGMGCAIGLMVVGQFAMDAPNYMLAVQFNLVQREDALVSYDEPRGPQATLEMAAMEGVMQVEPFRALPAWLRHGHRIKRVEVMGLTSGGGLHQLLDAQRRPVDLPAQGLVLSAKLARILQVAPGDRVTLEALEGQRPVLDIPVVGLVDDMLGLGAYMDALALARLLGEDQTTSGVFLRIQADLSATVYERLKRLPAVAGVAVRGAVQQSARDTMERAFFTASGVLMAFACVTIGGMVYNSARIALSERGHELASLSVLGFTRREVAFLLLGEQALLVAVAMPLGLGIGHGLCALLVPLFDRELFRVPLVIEPMSYAYAVLVAAMAATLSGVLVAWRIRRLDLIAVLKTRE